MSLRQYITEAEVRQIIPEAGDYFDIELEDGTLLETYIIGVRNSAILLDATPDIIGVLREWADLDGEAGEVLFEGQFKKSMHTAAESMSLKDFVERYGHLFSPGEAERFWHSINDTVKENAWAGVNPRVDQPRIAGTNQRAKSGYYPEPKPLVKKLDKPTDRFDKVTKEDHFVDEPVDADAGEYDYEGDMAKDDLETIIRAARRLTGMLDDNENMPEWVQSKINKAADYVDTAADYIESNQDELGVAEGSHEDQIAKAAAYNQRMSSNTPPIDLGIREVGNWAKVGAYGDPIKSAWLNLAKYGVRNNRFNNSVSKLMTAIGNFPDLDDDVYDMYDINQNEVDILYNAYETVYDQWEQLQGQQGVAEGKREGYDTFDDYREHGLKECGIYEYTGNWTNFGLEESDQLTQLKRLALGK